MGFTNLYGTDVTAERAIVKFPDQNPNPVFRIDRSGTLVYANPASTALVSGIGASVGTALPAALRQRLLERVQAADPTTVELESGGSTYALLPVDVPEFGFINVYGTDVTAVKERERLARENERLLLNILPEPIAERLRQGEPLIADRFDDVTLLFADIVEFTQLSSTLSAPELVTVLNDVFSAFDRLVDAYGLEKVKTIGDAYMVVGGMLDGTTDHTARVAAMALDLTAAVGRIESAARLGIGFRIGIHCGPVVAGVIGTRKFIYDIWGDTVNMASRMESLGVPGRIQVTYQVMDRLRGSFVLEERGLIDVKGKGPTPTWFLDGRIAAGPATSAPSRRSGPAS
jgi:class 3 adenylate cyclase